MARLRVRATAPSRLRSIRLRWLEGGPTYVIDLPLAPDSSQDRNFLLPAAWSRQTYQADLIGSEIPDPQRQVELIWGARQALEPFPDAGVYDPFQQDQPRWPARLRRNLFLLGVGALVLGAAALLPRSRPGRLGILVLALATTGVGGWLALRGVATVTHRTFSRRLGGQEVRLEVLTALRPGTWESVDDGLVPRYQNFEQILTDAAQIHLGREVRVPLEPDDLRIFQRVEPATVQSESSDSHGP
jgi:hypothetical protein